MVKVPPTVEVVTPARPEMDSRLKQTATLEASCLLSMSALNLDPALVRRPRAGSWLKMSFIQVILLLEPSYSTSEVVTPDPLTANTSNSFSAAF